MFLQFILSKTNQGPDDENTPGLKNVGYIFLITEKKTDMGWERSACSYIKF